MNIEGELGSFDRMTSSLSYTHRVSLSHDVLMYLEYTEHASSSIGKTQCFKWQSSPVEGGEHSFQNFQII